LPTVYCDFLLTLYTRGKTLEVEQENGTRDSKLKIFLKYLCLTVFVPLIIFIYASNHIPIRIVGMLIVILLIGGLYFFFVSKDMIVKHFALLICLFAIFLFTISLSKLFTSQLITNYVIFINFVSWFILGFKKNYTYIIVLS